MSATTFHTDNLALAQTLTGVAGLETQRIIDRKVELITFPLEGDEGKPALVIWIGNGHHRVKSFRADGLSKDEGEWAEVWHLYMPWDDEDKLYDTPWEARWMALRLAVENVLSNPEALKTGSRPLPIEWRAGEEPPMWLRNTPAPGGMELFYTVSQEEF